MISKTPYANEKMIKFLQFQMEKGESFIKPHNFKKNGLPWFVFMSNLLYNQESNPIIGNSIFLVDYQQNFKQKWKL